MFFGHIWSSKIDFGLAAVLTSAPVAEYNNTAGAVLSEVQYTTMRLTGTGSHFGADQIARGDVWDLAMGRAE